MREIGSSLAARYKRDHARRSMADSKNPSGDEGSGPSADRRSASQDLAEGLELMLRAARKAARHVEPSRIEELGRRAARSVENFDSKAAKELGRKAVRTLDPRRIEEIAEDAGRELLNVVERVADRVESIVTGSAVERPRASGGSEAPKGPAAGAENAAAEPGTVGNGASSDGEKTRVRIKED